MDPAKIEEESFRRIEALLPASIKGQFTHSEWEVTRRIIHTTGDPEFYKLVRFSKGAVDEGVKALLEKKGVYADTRMLLSGISTGRLKELSVSAFCLINDNEVVRRAKESSITRAAASIDSLIDRQKKGMDTGIVAIGNAPTALFYLLDAIKEISWRPSLIIGTPVGFVGAEESKEALMASDIPFITCVGTRGGSTVAASIVNALAIMALRKKTMT